MASLFSQFASAIKNRDGYGLGDTFLPEPSDENPDRLVFFWGSTNAATVKNDFKRYINDKVPRSALTHKEVEGWVEIFTAFWKAVQEILAMDTEGGTTKPASTWTQVYAAWKELTLVVIRGYSNYGFEAWTIPCLYVVSRYLRLFAIRSDEERSRAGGENNNVEFGAEFDPEEEKQKQLRDCEQQLKRIFTLCLSDRAPLEESRKWGIYYIINLLFKTYFKLNSASLARTILKALTAYQGDMPGLDAFPKSQRVTFKYYEGVLAFLEENYPEAERHLTEAWLLCHRDAKENLEQILTYLIPCHMLTNHSLPSQKLLEPYPRLQEIFLPLCKCIKRGDLRGFDLALQEGEEEFVKRRIYLTLERGRDIALRNLLRKVFLAGGFEEAKEPEAAPVRRTRVPVAEFAAAISLGSRETIDSDEVECLLANMIYKGFMKGYIARERGIVVLSKGGAFPQTGV